MRLSLCLALMAVSSATAAEPETPIRWKKTVLDKAFRSEGVAVADINKDGKLDIINGEVWYEAPDWKMHEFRKSKDYTDGQKNVYSNSFCVWCEDINGDGWLDIIVIGFPGAPCHWYENPGNQPGYWKQHEIWHSACNETPQYVDLFGNGKRVLVMGWQPKDSKGNMGQMAYFKPGPDPTKPWEMHPISEPSAQGKEIPGTQRFSHGLGCSDVNGDGRLDVICTGGWWEQPAKDDGKPWKFHPARLGEACADMYAFDIDGDGKNDILSTSAHKFGIWWHQQKPGKEHPEFVTQVMFKELVSETHACVMADINGDGLKDFITGKRWWSHGRAEPGADGPAIIYWFEAKKASDGVISFTPHVVDKDSGIGTQFTVADVNGDGLLDIVTSNKKGTFLLQQVRDKK